MPDEVSTGAGRTPQAPHRATVGNRSSVTAHRGSPSEAAFSRMKWQDVAMARAGREQLVLVVQVLLAHDVEEGHRRDELADVDGFAHQVVERVSAHLERRADLRPPAVVLEHLLRPHHPPGLHSTW
jgi:hypothetical protein